MSKYLVAPLNWGLGHASRCVPLVQQFLDEGHEVILGGDGESLTLLRRHFPRLRYTYLAPLNLRYSAGKTQVWAMLKSLPKIIRWAIKDHQMLQALLREEPIDCVVSDNRFGLYVNQTSNTTHHTSSITHHTCECIYITHQLHIMLPRGWKWAEGIASRIHARIYTRYNKVWIPDYEDFASSLAGELSHPHLSIFNSQFSIFNYIGPLSRWASYGHVRDANDMRTVYYGVAVLSGLEPQRTMLEKELIARFTADSQITNSHNPKAFADSQNPRNFLIVQGLMNRPNTRIKRGSVTIVPYMNDAELASYLLGAQKIIVRSGYSTIMDMHALGIDPSKIEFIPTLGQPEQEYLAFWAKKRTSL